MILSEFSKFLQLHNEELLAQKTSPLFLLEKWISSILSRKPISNVDKIIHKEILYAKNSAGEYFLAGKSDSGRILLKTLIEFCKSYDNYSYAKWLEAAEQAFYQGDI